MLENDFKQNNYNKIYFIQFYFSKKIKFLILPFLYNTEHKKYYPTF